MSSLLLKPLEVAHLLGLSRSKVFEMLAAEELPVVRIGRAVRVPRGDLEDWIRARIKVRSSSTLLPTPPMGAAQATAELGG